MVLFVWIWISFCQFVLFVCGLFVFFFLFVCLFVCLFVVVCIVLFLGVVDWVFSWFLFLYFFRWFTGEVSALRTMDPGLGTPFP